MASRYRRNGQSRNDNASEYAFPADRYALLVIQRRPPLPADQILLKRLIHAGGNVAQRLLFSNGYSRYKRGDIAETAAECMSQLACNLRGVAVRAAEARPTTHLTLPDLLGLVRKLSFARAAVDEPAQAGEPSNAARLLVALEDMEDRVLHTTPDNFRLLAERWTSPQIMETVLAARGRIASFTFKALINTCIDAVAEPNHSLTRLIDADVDEVRIDDQYRQRDRRVMSPHDRAVVGKACRDVLHAIGAQPTADATEMRDRTYLKALVEAMLLLLDAPDENLYALARMRLEGLGERPEDIKRGLAAAMRHTKFKQLCAQIDRGLAWH